MSDEIINKTITIESVEQKTFDNGRTKFKIRADHNYGLWKLKKDGSEMRAYTFFKTLGPDAVGKTVSIAYKEDPGEYNGKAITYRTIIGMRAAAQVQPQADKNLEGRVQILESKLRMLEQKLAGDKVQEIADAYGGTVVKVQEPQKTKGHGDAGYISVDDIPF